MSIINDLVSTLSEGPDDEFVNDFTREMDKHLIRHTNDYFKTYIDDHKYKNNSYAFRYPGVTRGCIMLDDNNIITRIILYKDIPAIYDDEAEKIFDKYIGMALVLDRTNKTKESIQQAIPDCLNNITNILMSDRGEKS